MRVQKYNVQGSMENLPNLDSRKQEQFMPIPPSNYQYRTARNSTQHGQNVHQSNFFSQDQRAAQRDLDNIHATDQGNESQEDIINLGPDGLEQYTGSSQQQEQNSLMQRRIEMQRAWNPLVLEDFNSDYLKINKVPKNASQTCMGQRLIKPIVNPILFDEKDNRMNRLNRGTVAQFDLT